jgi:SAM-dependent methyltransferase
MPAAYADILLREVQAPTFLRATLGGTPRLKKTGLIRVGLRPVDLADGRFLQVSRFDDRKDFTSNHRFEDAPAALAELLEIGFANVHIGTTTEEIDLRLTKKGALQTSRRPKLAAAAPAAPGPLAHNRVKQVPLPEGAGGEVDVLLEAMRILDRNRRVRPTMRAKYTQINEFLKLLDHVLPEVLEGRDGSRPLQILDAGCGASYLTLAAHHYLHTIKKVPTHTLGIDANEEVIATSREKARQLESGGGEASDAAPRLEFRTGRIGGGELADVRPEIVLALHACDTATDDAIAQAITSGAKLLLAVPCCHKFLNARLDVPALRPLHRHGILHQRFADLVTDTFRALILRLAGYRTDVVEFISPEHTARNLMIRAVKAVPPGDPAFLKEYAAFKAFTGVTPYLEMALGSRFPA